MRFQDDHGDLLRMNTATFDLNARFEFILLSILPSALFIVVTVWQLALQARKPAIISARRLQIIKTTLLTVHAVVNIVLVALSAQLQASISAVFIAAASLKALVSLLMVPTSLLHHFKSARPSAILCGYLFLTLLLDAAQVRTLGLASYDTRDVTYIGLFGSSLALKLVILLFECYPKDAWLAWDVKTHSPEELSSIFSISVYFWLNKLFLHGYRKVMAISDLYPLDSALDCQKLHACFVTQLDYSKFQDDKYALLKSLLWTLRVPFLLPILPRLALLAFTFCQPLFIERLLEHLTHPVLEANVGYGFIGASFLIYSGIAVSMAVCWYLHHRTRTMVRSILVVEIFEKALRCRLGNTDSSTTVTLMSTDAERIDIGIRSLHDIWASLIQAALASWMLYNKLGLVILAPMGIVLVSFAILVILMRFTGDSQREWMTRVERRVGLTSMVISSMKNLKMSGLAVAVGGYIHGLRVDELEVGSRFRKIIIAAALLGYIPLLLGPPITFALAQRSLDATRMFTSLSYLFLLTNPLSHIFQCIPQLLAAVACLGRIQKFLMGDEHIDFRTVEPSTTDEKSQDTPNRDITHNQVSITLRDGAFRWQEDKAALSGVNIQFQRSSLTVVIGPVGSGKSTLCKALIGEIPFQEGTIHLQQRHARTGYCDQSPFLFNGTVKENIIGFSEFDQERYNVVVQATALSFDFKLLALGDETSVGSDGVALSGGQKQRIALARALYLQTDLLILDDVFSGLDADTEERVFKAVFGSGGLLKRRGTTVILCTHSFKHVLSADFVVALQSGIVTQQGKPIDLIQQKGYIQELGLRMGQEGSAEETGSTTPEDEVKESKTDHTAAAAAVLPNMSQTSLDASRQIGDKAVYKHYIKSMGIVVTLCSFITALFWGLFTNFPTIWLKYWSDEFSSQTQTHSSRYYAGIYTVLQLGALISLLLLGITIFLVSVKRAGSSLHQTALNTLIHAPLSFFTNTDTGVVTNLFSQDLNLIDSELPMALLSTLICTFQAIGQAAVMLTSSAYIAISYPFLAVLLCILASFYLRTSRQLRLLDLEAKSPLCAHFLDVTRGIATLRAFGFKENEKAKNALLVNTNQRPAYLLLMSQQWLNFVLDAVVTIMAVILTTLAVQLHSNSAFTGASLVTLMTFGDSLSGIVIYYTRLETSLGAISRLKAFNETVQSENKASEDFVPPKLWPQTGSIELRGVSASYQDYVPDAAPLALALKDITLSIKTGERVAICGRTGSGKSSFIGLLLKLLSPIQEHTSLAKIDGLDLSRIERSSLRQQLLTVPQEAVFLPDGASFQENLDLAGTVDRTHCEAALRAVGMWETVEERGGLTAGMTASTLSAGQKQLFSLARAVCRQRARARESVHSGILLLDEVSSNVDKHTELCIQQILRSEFKGYTVVAVSHRLDMIMDFDKVVVLNQGAIVEVGVPLTLAETGGSWFSNLVKAAAS